MMIIMMVYCLDILKGIAVDWFYKLRFFNMELLVYLQTELYRIFGEFFRVKNFECMILSRFLGIHFLNGLRYRYALRVFGRCSEKSGSTQRHVVVATCSTSESGRDNILYGIA